MILAISTSAWSGTLEEACKGIADAGVHSADLICIENWGHVDRRRLETDYAGELSRISSTLARHEIRPVAANLAIEPALFKTDDTSLGTRAEVARHYLRLLRDLGIKAASFYPRYKQETTYERVYTATVSSIRHLVDIGNEHDVELGPELHFATNLETLQQAARLLSDLPDLRIAFDPSHFICQGNRIEDTEFLLDHAHHVHLRPAASGTLQTTVSAGGEPIRWVMRRLAERDYSGVVSIELLPEEGVDPRSEIDAMVRLVSEFL